MPITNNDFTAQLTSIDTKVCVSGFAGDSTFVSVRFGDNMKGGEFCLIVTPSEAHALADALTRAALYSEPRIASADDLGIAA